MVITMQFCFLSICHGFLLLNKTGISSVGSDCLTDCHCLTLTDELGIQKQLLAQMKLIILQLKNELKTLKQEVNDLKSGNNANQSLAVAALKLKSVTQSRVLLNWKWNYCYLARRCRIHKCIQCEKHPISYDILHKKFDSLQTKKTMSWNIITLHWKVKLLIVIISILIQSKSWISLNTSLPLQTFKPLPRHKAVWTRLYSKWKV